jgi:NAD(P)-dependent dehydrogenase (short-subunit alcohol dehydrogenase family)
MCAPVVLITGALTGIGRAAALAFAKQGNRIVVSGRKQDAGEASVAELRALGAEAEFVRADVRNEDDVRRLIDRTVERFGRLDVAINNAGTEGKPGLVVDQTAESYAATFDTNVLGTLLSLKHELRVMTAQGSGSIVNISSTYGHEGARGASVYAGSKHAIEGLTKSAALEAALPACGSTPWRPARRKPVCLTASPGRPSAKRRLRRACRSAGSAIPTRSPARLSSSPLMPRRS